MTAKACIPITADHNGGVHPAGWRWELLTDVAKLATGHTPDRNRPEYWNGGIPWVSLTEIRNLDGRIARDTVLKVSSEGIRNSSAVLLPIGTVCFSRTASIGFVTITGVEMSTSQDFVNWICGDRLDPLYLMHALRASRQQLRGLSSGSTHKTIYMRIAEKLRVLLPPIEDQRRIAAVLEAADALRSKRLEALAELDTLTRAVFIDVFGDLVVNHRGWPVEPLRNLCAKIQIGPFGSLLHQSDYVEGGVPIVNPMHLVGGSIRSRSDQTITAEKHATLEAYWLRAGDVVMGRRGEMGRCAVVGSDEEGWLCGSGSLYFRPDPQKLSPIVLANVLSGRSGRDRLERLSQGVTMSNLNSDMVEGFAIGVPPLELQQTFRRVVDRHAAMSSLQRKSLGDLDSLSAALQQRSFAGDL